MMPNSTLGYLAVGRVYLSGGEAGRAFDYFNKVSKQATNKKANKKKNNNKKTTKKQTKHKHKQIKKGK
jgi:hypothetical protein